MLLILFQLGLHWRLSKQRCDSSSMMEYVSTCIGTVSVHTERSNYLFMCIICTVKLVIMNSLGPPKNVHYRHNSLYAHSKQVR